MARFAHHRRRIVLKLQPIAPDNGIEGPFEIHLGRIAFAEGYLAQRLPRRAPAREIERGRGPIDAHDPPGFADEICGEKRDVPGPAADVENVHADPETCLAKEIAGYRIDEPRLRPQAVQLERRMAEKIRCALGHEAERCATAADAHAEPARVGGFGRGAVAHMEVGIRRALYAGFTPRLSGPQRGALTSSGCESHRRSRARPGRFFFALSRWRVRLERGEQPTRYRRDVVDRGVERVFVGPGWPGEPAHLAHELQRRRADLFLGHRRLEVEKDSDVSAHGSKDRCPMHASCTNSAGSRQRSERSGAR
jgi:hypothetical protein